AGYDAWVNTQIPASINIVEKQVVTITGQVFEDNSGSTAVNSYAYNGIKDAGELGIADSVISINNCNNTTAIATTKTDANGNYSFNLLPTELPAGNFCIAQKNLDGYSSVSGTTGYNRVT
ncbi:SdrD B-like domain-containing protein, partial [Rhizobium hidalgonense]